MFKIFFGVKRKKSLICFIKDFQKRNFDQKDLGKYRLIYNFGYFVQPSIFSCVSNPQPTTTRNNRIEITLDTNSCHWLQRQVIMGDR